jgi:hypothetical protein
MFPQRLEVSMANLYTNSDSGNRPPQPPVKFAGHFSPEGTSGAYFKNTHGLLVKVCERKEFTPLRPRLYLMHRTDDGQFRYLTSLYPMPSADMYRAEIAGRYFSVCVFPDGSAISVLPI